MSRPGLVHRGRDWRGLVVLASMFAAVSVPWIAGVLWLAGVL